MKYLDDLTTMALLGTGRAGAAALPEPPAPLAELDVRGGSPEATLLRAAGAAALVDRAGRRTPKLAPVAGFVMPDDARPVCTPAAAALLSRLLAQGDGRLLAVWLSACAAAGRRPPRKALAAIFDAVTKGMTGVTSERRLSLASATLAAVGPAGAWLARQNPAWATLAARGVPSDLSAAWETGTKAERLAALRVVRADDPARARAMVGAVIADEPAEVRAELVAALALGLSAEDEALLESRLTDRSKEVRAAAADLLARLPGSAYAGRMKERLASLLTLQPAGKRSGGPTLVVTLPAELTPEMKADAIEPKHPPYGDRQGQLFQMLARVPPGHWSAAFGLPAAELIAAAEKDHRELLVAAWTRAAILTRDGEWAEAIQRTALGGKRPEIEPELVAAIPPERYQRFVVDVLDGDAVGGVEALQSLIGEHTPELSQEAASALLRFVDGRVRKGGSTGYALPYVLPELAMRVPASMYGAFAAGWGGEGWARAGSALERFLATLELRASIGRELSG